MNTIPLRLRIITAAKSAVLVHVHGSNAAKRNQAYSVNRRIRWNNA